MMGLDRTDTLTVDAQATGAVVWGIVQTLAVAERSWDIGSERGLYGGGHHEEKLQLKVPRSASDHRTAYASAQMLYQFCARGR